MLKPKLHAPFMEAEQHLVVMVFLDSCLCIFLWLERVSALHCAEVSGPIMDTSNSTYTFGYRVDGITESLIIRLAIVNDEDCCFEVSKLEVRKLYEVRVSFLRSLKQSHRPSQMY